MQRFRTQQKRLNISVDTVPDAPSLTENATFNKAMVGIRAFELKQMSYTINNCSMCHERRLEMPMFQHTDVCWRCHFEKSNIKMFSNENNINPSHIPVQLQNLSVIEQ